MPRPSTIVFLFLLAACCQAQPDPYANRNDSALFRYVFDIPGEYINDHCLIYKDSLWHLYFIEGVKSFEIWHRDGNQVLIGHATSPDLFHWTLLEPALKTGAAGTLDAGHVTAPYVIERAGTYYMYYVGKEAGVGYFAGEHMMLATSKDLYNWTRHFTSPIMRPDTNWACYWPNGYLGGSGGPISCRDAHVTEDPKHGYILYYVARLRGDPDRPSVDQEYSCVAAATSTDLTHWTDRGPVLTRRTTGTETMTYAHPESPCVFKRGQYYYLFWKGGDGTRYVMSEDPLDFEDKSEYFLATSHASDLIEWNGKWYITSCSREVNDIAHRYSDRNNGLFLAGITWRGIWPEVTLLPELSAAPEEPSHKTSFMLYPNPAVTGEPVWLGLPGSLQQPVSVTISDLLGRVVLQVSNPALAIDQAGGVGVELNIGELPPGIYLMRGMSGGRSFGEKLMVR